ncbi:TonB-dependent siderophore receptor [Larsenimonas suaedae]|uniref:TonB-dependent siderophore receptor n=1 Tax=Larsenimonas suaedae TaxID=1851019 RepID=A0ABU1GS05_9GAMM|nr:TonB-dependent siderophore receptor [Larsenimonas suaedae]MCM2972409.1 TonB-dependent siderophore receptor [Larsenimonas suaedae]MDR5894795.1 TonB-dependent siderophore receptor [Larsenimonas suaedae]
MITNISPGGRTGAVFVTSPQRARVSALGVTFAALVLSGPALAERGETVTVESSALQQSPIGTDGSIIADRTTTGSKTDTALLDLSSTVSVVTEEEIAQRKAQDLEQVLGYTAGVSVGQYGSDNRYDYFMIRGFDNTALGTYRDGLAHRTVNFTGSRLEPYGLQRIDVLKGSTSSLFGLNAPGGLVNAITKRPTEYAFGEVYTTLGDGHQETGADVGGPINAEWRYRLTAKWQEADRGARHTEDDRLYLAPALTWAPSAQTSLTFLADFNQRDSNASNAIPYGSNIDPQTFLGEPGYDAMNTIERNLGFDLRHAFGNGLSLEQTARYTHTDLTLESVYLGAADPAVSREAYGILGESDQYNIDSRLIYDAELGNISSKTLAGIEYTHTDTTEAQRYGSAGGIDITQPRYCGRACIDLAAPVRFHQKREGQGYYLQEELTFDERWILTLGGRYDEVETESLSSGTASETTDYAFTKRAGLTYKATESLSLYANYSESFQPPASRTLLVGRAEPQEGTQYEVGMKYRPETLNALVTVAAFDLTQTNVATQVTPTRYRQIGEVSVQGLELEGKLALAERLNLIAAYSYWDARIDRDGFSGNEGNRPGLVPRHMASFWADYTLPGDELTLGLGTRFVGSSYSDDANTVKAASYTLVEAMARYRFTPRVDLTVNAHNLFDREYITDVNPFSNSAFYGEGRSVLGTLRYHW